MKYFDKSRLSKQAHPTLKEATRPPTDLAGKAMEEITRQTSGLYLSTNERQRGQVKGQKATMSAIPGHVMSEGTNGEAGSVRRSPRLAKRARPLNDEVCIHGN